MDRAMTMASRLAPASVSSSSTRVVARSGRRATHISRTPRVTRAKGAKDDDDARQGAQDGKRDWDGAWDAFKRDFVGSDAKMPSDYVDMSFKSSRRAPDADAKDRIRADEDLVLNWWTSPTFAVAGVGAAALLLFLFVVVIGPPPSDGRCTLPWC